MSPGDPVSRAGRVRAAGLILGLVFAGWFLWLCQGILPVAPIEGDEQGVLFGAAVIAAGQDNYRDVCYLYDIQPGSYQLIAGLSRVAGLTVESTFAVLSAGGALLFAAFTALLLRRLLATPWALVLAAVFLCQEIWAGAYYLNTTAVGGWLALGALLLLLDPATPTRRGLVAGLLALSGWIRIDCLLISLAVPAFLWRTDRDWRQSLRSTVLIAVPALLAFAALFRLSDASLVLLVNSYRERMGYEGWLRLVQMYPLATSALLALLSLAGAGLLLAKERRVLALICASGVLPTVAVYGASLASNKYLYLALPFCLAAALLAAERLHRSWRGWPPSVRAPIFAVGALLLAFDTGLGVLTSSDAARSFQPRPRIASLARFGFGGRQVEIALGSGERINSTDGYRLRGGALFAPAAWSADKADVFDRLGALASVLRHEKACSLFWGDWLGYQMGLRLLRQEGFVFSGRLVPAKSFPYSGAWRRGGQIVEFGFLAYTDSEYFRPGPRLANPTGTRTFFIASLLHRGPVAELEDRLAWKTISPDPFGHIRILQRL